jgi:hypothetical protein
LAKKDKSNNIVSCHEKVSILLKGYVDILNPAICKYEKYSL